MNKKIIYIISALFLIGSLYLVFKMFFQPLPTPNSKPTTQVHSPSPATKEAQKIVKPITEKPEYIPPTPTPDPQIYACGPGGACNSYQDPEASGCPITFNDRYCENKCYNSSIRCTY